MPLGNTSSPRQRGLAASLAPNLSSFLPSYSDVALWLTGLRGAGGDRAPRTPLPAVGDEITGKVSRTAGWGVFVDLENNIRGLLHADEVAVPEGGGGRDPNIRAMFSEGDEIKVRPHVRALHLSSAALDVCLLSWAARPARQVADGCRCMGPGYSAFRGDE